MRLLFVALLFISTSVFSQDKKDTTVKNDSAGVDSGQFIACIMGQKDWEKVFEALTTSSVLTGAQINALVGYMKRNMQPVELKSPEAKAAPKK